MSELRELDIKIEKNSASFAVSKTNYEGPHGLTAETLGALNTLRAEGTPTEYGKVLFEALFRDRLEEGYRAARQEVLEARARWRIRLKIAEGAAELHGLWWESLYDPTPPPRVLGRWRETPLSRYLGHELKDPVSTEKIKVLAVVSNPTDLGQGAWEQYSRLDEDAEVAVLESAFSTLGDRVDLDFQTSPASFARIRDRLRNEHFHVLHIVGHAALQPGSGEGCLLLETDEEETRPLGQEKVGQLVDDLPDLQLVVLSACHSAERSRADAFVGLAPQMIRYGVPAVVAMQDRIGVETARVFTQKFYRALGSPDSTGGMVDAALNWARDDLYTEFESQEGWDWAIPVLFMRGEGLLFEFAAGGAGTDATHPSGTSTESPTMPARIPTAGRSLESAKADLEPKPGADLAPDEAHALYKAMAFQLQPDELDTICRLLWRIDFDNMPGDTEDKKLVAIVDRCRDEDQIGLLADQIQTQVKLRDKRAREKESATIVDLQRWTRERAS